MNCIEVVTLVFFSHSASSEAQIRDTVSDEGVNYEVYGLYGPEVQCMAGSSVMLAAALFCANDG